MHNSYKEVKNYIHNEANISKEEIREIIRESVKNEVAKIVVGKSDEIDGYINNYIASLVRNSLGDGGSLMLRFKERVSQKLSDEVGKFVYNSLDFSIAVKDESGKIVKEDCKPCKGSGSTDKEKGLFRRNGNCEDCNGTGFKEIK